MSRRETVVITGASAGVGRATVRRFARDRARIALIARGHDGLESARREVEEAGGEALVLPLDVADSDAVLEAAERVEADLGPIDVWINNAMVTALAPFEELELADFRRITEVNYLGAVYGTRAALEHMRPHDRGTIVQVGSALAYRAIPLQSAYCGSKFAMRGFTDAVRTELMHDGSGIHLTMVHLPAVNTPQFDWCKTTMPNQPMPVPPIFQPEVAADAIHYAAHAKRREIWVGGPAILAIVGNKLAPAVADWKLARDGYRSQQTDHPLRDDHVDNLYEPRPGDHGAHGRFDEQATGTSAQLWATEHRGWLWAAAGAAVAAGVGGWLARSPPTTNARRPGFVRGS